MLVQDENQRQSKYELVLERKKRFTQLESDIIDLNVMFKDLAVMVHDQDETIGI